MQPRVLERLHRVMQAVRAAEEVRLGELLARIDASRKRVRELRGWMLESPLGQVPDGAEIFAIARWRARLTAEIRAENARAAELAAQAVAMRAKLSRALGRESAAAELLHKARLRARRDAMRRADLAAATPRPGAGDEGPAGQSAVPVSPLSRSAFGS